MLTCCQPRRTIRQEGSRRVRLAMSVEIASYTERLVPRRMLGEVLRIGIGPEAAARGQSTDLDPGFVKDLQDGPLFRLPLAAPAGAISPVAARATPLRD